MRSTLVFLVSHTELIVRVPADFYTPPNTCSGDLAAQGKTPCCDYCCPTNTTEAYYREHPEAYATHPPVFLAQSEIEDSNADLCAGRYYYEAMKAHGATAEIAL